ncbi:hypothetical protein F0229_13320 [Vibrio sp. AIC-3]|uniref:hypothetical protein n=1 Tax=Vibrio sp. AIC-3 TaxID=2607604 RepID=UPI0014933C51|nr:hypothetical protein [Vibrio sp. AIC-3]NOH93538.1 hypothetical protein [Vibrio sp. AIC-3]
MNELKKLLEAKKQTALIKGSWFAIQWRPDIATGEVLNIGVGYKTSEGHVSVQMLDYFDRIECLYSKEMIFHVELACEVARYKILSGGFDKNIAPQITCEERGFAQGKSEHAVLSRLFTSVVTLGKKKRVRAATRSFTSVNRDALYNSLKNQLKLDLNLSYSKHVPENPNHEITNSNIVHRLYLPFRKDTGNATLISAAYKDTQRVKCNLFDGSRDMEIAVDELKTKNNAIFLMLPGDGLDIEKQHEIENDIDKFVWMMKKHAIKVECESTETELAHKVSEWCLSAA